MARGFSMIEVLVAMGILLVILGVGMFASIDMLHRTVRRSERDTVVALLQRARSRAMANVLQQPWGVCFDGKEYVLFSGTHSASAVSREKVEASEGAGVADLSATPAFPCSDGGIVFAQLSGTTTEQDIVITQGMASSTISTNSAGRIDW